MGYSYMYILCIQWNIAKSLQLCPQPHRQQPTRLSHPWDSLGKNTGVGCHFLLQCMKVKSESEVTQSCPTLSDPMDCSLPGSSIHGIFQARVLEWGAIAFSDNGILLSHKKERIWVSSNEVEEPRAYYTEWSKSEREQQILLWFHLCRIPRIGKFTEIENRINFAWLKEGKMGIYCLMGIEFPSGMMKKFWKWTMAIIVQHWWIYLMTLNSIPQKD